MIQSLFYGLGVVTGFALLLVILSLCLFFLHKTWVDWHDGWMKTDTARLATFMRIAFERGDTDIGETWRVDGKKLKIIDVKEKNGESGE